MTELIWDSEILKWVVRYEDGCEYVLNAETREQAQEMAELIDEGLVDEV
jgi:hypothetical protein